MPGLICQDEHKVFINVPIEQRALLSVGQLFLSAHDKSLGFKNLGEFEVCEVANIREKQTVKSL
jgi:hypothetical protein